MTPATEDRTQVCIAGGGPAGIFLGYLLARGGVEVTVFEKHADFLRDFRGDTVHPSTLEILQECGLLEKFDKLSQHRVQHLSARIGERALRMIDFSTLKPFDFLAFVPQWDFLNLLVEEASAFINFRLQLRHEVTGLIREHGRVAGITVCGPDGEKEIRCDLVVGCDGRQSTVRASADLVVRDLGAPMDVLWFRLPRGSEDPEETQAIVGAGKMMVLLNRNDYWQVAYVVPKGSDGELRAMPIELFRELIAQLVPFLAKGVAGLGSWEEVRTLVVKVDRLERWCAPGLLLIGDAAHAMSPVGGVGINLAVQDAVAAANIIAEAFAGRSSISTSDLEKVQSRRETPTKLVQRLQLVAQKRVVAKALADHKPPAFPAWLRFFAKFRWFRNVPARVIGYGFRREHVDSAILAGRPPEDCAET